MYRPQSEQVSIFEDGVSIPRTGTNDWVKLAKMIPWAELERRYAQTFTSEVGNVGKSARMAIGALVIKERYGFFLTFAHGKKKRSRMYLKYKINPKIY